MLLLLSLRSSPRPLFLLRRMRPSNSCSLILSLEQQCASSKKYAHAAESAGLLYTRALTVWYTGGRRWIFRRRCCRSRLFLLSQHSAKEPRGGKREKARSPSEQWLLLSFSFLPLRAAAAAAARRWKSGAPCIPAAKSGKMNRARFASSSSDSGAFCQGCYCC